MGTHERSCIGRFGLRIPTCTDFQQATEYGPERFGYNFRLGSTVEGRNTRSIWSVSDGFVACCQEFDDPLQRLPVCLIGYSAPNLRRNDKSCIAQHGKVDRRVGGHRACDLGHSCRCQSSFARSDCQVDVQTHRLRDRAQLFDYIILAHAVTLDRCYDRCKQDQIHQ